MVTARAVTAPLGAPTTAAEMSWLRRRRSVLGAVVMLVGVFGWVLWRTGTAPTGYLDFFEHSAATWPHSVPSGSQYVLRVPLGQVAYRLLPVHSVGVYLALNVACLLVAFGVLGAWLCRRLGGRTGLVAAAVVILAPVTAVLLLTVGLYDPFSILAWTALLAALGRGGRWQFAAAVLAGIQDFEQIAVGVVLVLLIPALSGAAGLRPRTRPLLVGLVLGRAALEVYLHSVGAGAGSRLSYIAHWDVLYSLLGSTVANGPLIVWSALAGLWGFALTALLRTWGLWRHAERRNFVLAVGIWAGAGVLSADHTRVLALTSFALVVMGAMVIAQRYPDWRALVRLPQTWMLMLAPAVVIGGWNAVTLGL